MELNAKVFLHKNGTYELMVEEKKGSDVFMEVSPSELSEMAKKYGERSASLKKDVEAAKPIEKKARIKAFLKRVLEKHREKKSKAASEKAKSGPATVIPSGKKNALIVSGVRLKEILTENKIRFSPYDYDPKDEYMVYRTPKRVSVSRLPSAWEREMNRLEKQLGIDIRTALG